MVKIKRTDSDIENIYTYFEFEGFDGWEQCDEILSILTDKLKFRLAESLDGIYSRHFILESEGFVFKLLHHEDFGNCLCNQFKMNEKHYDELGRIADRTLEHIRKQLSDKELYL